MGIFGDFNVNPDVNEDGEVVAPDLHEDTGGDYEDKNYIDFEGRMIGEINRAEQGFNEGKKRDVVSVSFTLRSIEEQGLHPKDDKESSKFVEGMSLTVYNEMPKSPDPKKWDWAPKQDFKLVRQLIGALMQIDPEGITKETMDRCLEDDGARILGQPVGIVSESDYNEPDEDSEYDEGKTFYNVVEFYPVQADGDGYERLQFRGLDHPDVVKAVKDSVD